MIRYKNFQFRWLATMSLVIALGACAVPTPYQPSEDGYGYREQQIEDNRYRVSFSGNPSTPRETVQNFLLYRAAELTLQKGFDYFTIADSDLERSTRYYSSGYVNDFGLYDYPYRRSYRRFYRPSFYSSNAYPINEYSSVADVIMAEGDKPEDDANAYDALDVLQQLQPQVRPAES